MHAVYAALQAGEVFAVDFVSKVKYFLYLFGLTCDQAELLQAAQQISNEVGSGNWYLAQSNQGDALSDAGQCAAAEQIFQTLRQQLGQMPSYQLCLTLGRLGRCLNEQGKTAEAIDYYQQALGVAGQLEPSKSVQRQISLLHTGLADVFGGEGNFTQAKIHYEHALTIAQELGDTCGLAVIQGQLGTLAMWQGDFAEAEQSHKMALAIFQSLKEPKAEATAWHQLGLLYQEAQTWQRAEQCYRESARIKEAQGDLSNAARSWNNLAIVAEAQGKTDVAESWFRKAIAVQRQGNPIELANSLNNLADLLTRQPLRLSEARELAEQTLTLLQTVDAASAEIWKTYYILAGIAVQQNDPQAANYRQLERSSYLQFQGMPYQMRQYAPLIRRVLLALGNAEHRADLEEQLQQASESRQSLAQAIQAILNGERNEIRLLEPLNYSDAAIIHLILQGIESPDSLSILFNDQPHRTIS